jgi:class 3 adenylate cyclase/predicted ATPase
MICSYCQTQNRDIASYCKACGRLLGENCPRCGTEMPEDAAYCDFCGHHLASPLPLEDLNRPAATVPKPGRLEVGRAHSSHPSSLQQYIPEELLAKLEAAGADSMAGERRVVTMLFCDVKDSTATAESLDPEEWAEIMNGAFEQMIAPVYRYEGTLARLTGDGILAFFGAPIAHEDDPQRAVLAGLEIVAGIEGYGLEVGRRYGLDFNVRVGINTGRVVVGAVGSDLRLEYTALGDAINVAARMEQSAEPGTVRVAENTYQHIAPIFELEDLGGVAVKGKGDPVHSYRVIGRKAEPGRLRGLADQESPLFGRDGELSAVREALDQLRLGIGGIIFLVGQAGLGKSRLIREIGAFWQADDSAQDAPRLWQHRPAGSYQAAEAYNCLKHLVQLMAGIAEGASPAEVSGSLQRLATSAATDSDDPFTAFATLLGHLGEEAGLEGEAFKRQLSSATVGAFSHLAEARPVALVIDDLHWVDTASVEIIRRLFQLVDTAPILFLCAMRPEREVDGWQLRTDAGADYPHRFKELTLRPLGQEDSQALLDNLLAGADLPPKSRALILENSGGNPFYIEEMVRTLGEGGMLDGSKSGHGRQIAVPDNLQALLVSRLDRLPDEERRVLQLAAVIGRSFDYRVLARVGVTIPELDERLARLQRSGLIIEASRIPERSFVFGNSLMRETVYASILRKARRDFHGRVAEAMLVSYPEQLDEYAVMLATHFYRAEDARAVPFNIQAGDAAFRLYANREAAGFYGQALEIALRVPEVDSDQLIHLFTRRGRALELESRFSDALANYEQMEKLAAERDDPALTLQALVLQGAIYGTANDRYDSELAEEMAGRALALARELGDEAAEARIQWILLNAYRLSNRTRQAQVAGELSLTLASKLNLREQMAFTSNDLPHVYYTNGQAERAAEVVAEASRLWRELDNLPMLADSLATASMIDFFLADFDGCIALSKESFELSRSIENLWGQSYSRFTVGDAYWQLGRPDLALEMMETCVRLGEEAGFMPSQYYVAQRLALVNAYLGQYDEARRLAGQSADMVDSGFEMYRDNALALSLAVSLEAGELEEAAAVHKELESAKRGPDPFFEIPVVEARCLFALVREDHQAALSAAGQVVALVGQLGAPVYVPQASYLLGKAEFAAGRMEAARDSLSAARAGAVKIRSRWQLWKILETLADLESAEDNTAAAESLLVEAREIVEGIAGRTPTVEMRDDFLATPAVKALLAKAPERPAPDAP